MRKQPCSKLARISGNWLIWLLVQAILTLSPAMATGEPAVATSSLAGGGVTVLIYHRFGEDKYPTTNITADRFREQMTYLKSSGYEVISLAKLVATLEAGEKVPSKSVVITIDDAYLSVYENAWPILRDFDYPFTIFIYSKAVNDGHWNYMSWEQVRELQGRGVDMQDHGYAHLRLASRPAATSDEAYRAWIRDDLIRSRSLMTRELGVRPRFFAVPYGEYNQTVLDVAKELGYESVLLQDPGSVSEDTDPFAIPREPILGVDWAGMDHFEDVLERVDLPFTEMRPRSIAEGEVVPEFGVRLLYPERYEPESLGIYVSELGWQPANLQNDYLRITNSAPLHRRLNRVAVSGREKASGRTAIRFWLLVNEKAPVNR